VIRIKLRPSSTDRESGARDVTCQLQTLRTDNLAATGLAPVSLPVARSIGRDAESHDLVPEAPRCRCARNTDGSCYTSCKTEINPSTCLKDIRLRKTLAHAHDPSPPPPPLAPLAPLSQASSRDLPDLSVFLSLCCLYFDFVFLQ
jgi:hypothetical protein